MKGMKTRNSTHAAFAQPDSSWSRKRSERIVIRIQIQITKKKISKARSRASPRLMSASGKGVSFRSFGSVRRPCAPLNFRTLFALPARCIRSFRHRVEHGGDRGGEVEARDSLAHRDREAGVGAVEQRWAEPVALGA